MDLLYKISYAGYLIVALIIIFTGFRYFFSDRIMTYLLDALDSDWDSLNPNHRVLLLNFMKSYAIGWVVTGVAILFLLQFPYSERETWSYWAMGFIALVKVSVITWRTYCVKTNTPGNPPLAGLISLLCITVFSCICSMISLIGTKTMAAPNIYSMN